MLECIPPGPCTHFRHNRQVQWIAIVWPWGHRLCWRWTCGSYVMTMFLCYMHKPSLQSNTSQAQPTGIQTLDGLALDHAEWECFVMSKANRYYNYCRYLVYSGYSIQMHAHFLTQSTRLSLSLSMTNEVKEHLFWCIWFKGHIKVIWRCLKEHYFVYLV